MKKPYLWISLIAIIVSVNVANKFAGVYAYHAVYVYNFIKYIDWPSDKKEGPFVIGVMGSSPIITELTDMASKKKVGSRDIIVNKLVSPANISTCNIVFIPETNTKDVETVIEMSRNKGVLVITETPGMTKKGSSINFIYVDGKLKFEINKHAATLANLNISAELMKLGIAIN